MKLAISESTKTNLGLHLMMMQDREGITCTDPTVDLGGGFGIMDTAHSPVAKNSKTGNLNKSDHHFRVSNNETALP